MSRINKVLRSIETPDGGRCVDLFMRPNGSFGFEEYRRDQEDGRGWFPIGFHSEQVYESEQSALNAAADCVSWLKGLLDI